MAPSFSGSAHTSSGRPMPAPQEWAGKDLAAAPMTDPERTTVAVDASWPPRSTFIAGNSTTLPHSPFSDVPSSCPLHEEMRKLSSMMPQLLPQGNAQLPPKAGAQLPLQGIAQSMPSQGSAQLLLPHGSPQLVQPQKWDSKEAAAAAHPLLRVSAPPAIPCGLRMSPRSQPLLNYGCCPDIGSRVPRTSESSEGRCSNDLLALDDCAGGRGGGLAALLGSAPHLSRKRCHADLLGTTSADTDEPTGCEVDTPTQHAWDGEDELGGCQRPVGIKQCSSCRQVGLQC